MRLIEEAIATLGIPGSIAVAMVLLFAVLQLIGEFIEAFGKVAPTALKLRKLLSKKKEEAKQLALEQTQTLQDVKTLLAEVNSHYNADNIAKRDAWMQWVNDRAVVYDAKVEELVDLKDALQQIAVALAENTRTTDEMFKESCRDRIISFASQVNKPLDLRSREEFDRIFKVYEAYEAFLQAHNEPNGQVEISFALIKEAYAERLKTNNFVEDIRKLK